MAQTSWEDLLAQMQGNAQATGWYDDPANQQFIPGSPEWEQQLAQGYTPMPGDVYGASPNPQTGAYEYSGVDAQGQQYGTPYEQMTGGATYNPASGGFETMSGAGSMQNSQTQAPASQQPAVNQGGVNFDEYGQPWIGNQDLGKAPTIGGSNPYEQGNWPTLGGGQNPYAFNGPQLGGSNPYGFETPTLGGGQNPYEGDWGQMDPAQMDLQSIPQTTAQTPGSSAALDFLLSGQGFDEATMARLRAQMIDESAKQGAIQTSRGKIAAQQAGLSGSGADMALQAQAARDAAAAQTKGSNNLMIQNAVQGLENQRIGAPLDLQRQTNSANMQNQMALENAAKLFSGMQQNVQNVQQASGTNTQNQQQQKMAGAGYQADTEAQNAQNKMTQNMAGAGYKAGTESQNAQNQQQQQMAGAGYTADIASQNAANQMTQKMAGAGYAANAESQNATNQINQGLNQAQMNRQQDQFNVGTNENRYGQSMNAMNSLIGGTNPTSLYQSAAGMTSQYNPNLIGANAYSNLGTSLLNYGR